jgi:hypothetical protein
LGDFCSFDEAEAAGIEAWNTRPLTGGVTELIERLQRRRDDAAALGGSSEIYLEEIDELIDLAMSNASRGG